MNESRLIIGCIEGDALCQRELVERYSPMLYTVALRYVGNTDDAQDILQDALIKIFKGLPEYKESGRFEAWLRTVVITTSLNVLRRDKKMTDVSDFTFNGAMANDPEAYAHLGAEELLALIQRLPDHFRAVFNLAVMEEYSHEEIAKELDISETTSRSILFRARKLLREMVIELEKVQL